MRYVIFGAFMRDVLHIFFMFYFIFELLSIFMVIRKYSTPYSLEVNIEYYITEGE